MQIIMRTQTRYNGAVLRPGDAKDIDNRTAVRWIGNGIAKRADAVSPEQPQAPNEAAEPQIPGSFNELRKLAKDMGITVPKGTNKQELIRLITAGLDEDTQSVKADEQKPIADEKFSGTKQPDGEKKTS